jgi:ribonuclease BN (tRNA processing enzyme)
MAAMTSAALVLLGTAGGPLPSTVRSGISQAVVVGGRVHLVDCGSGVTRQLRRARLLSSLHHVYLTHLHSDHDCDYFNLFLLGWPILQWNPPVQVFGPGPAGGASALPAEPAAPVVNPASPTPGLLELTERQFQAHAYDLNVRMREAGRYDLTPLVAPHEIELPPTLAASAPAPVAPPMDPIVVAEHDDVRVSAVLVQHAPVFPAFAFRFDTDAGSVVVSGDTAPCPNLIDLARGPTSSSTRSSTTDGPGPPTTRTTPRGPGGATSTWSAPTPRSAGWAPSPPRRGCAGWCSPTSSPATTSFPTSTGSRAPPPTSTARWWSATTS